MLAAAAPPALRWVHYVAALSWRVSPPLGGLQFEYVLGQLYKPEELTDQASAYWNGSDRSFLP